MISLDRLKEFLRYDPENGLFTWRVTRKVRAGTVAGSLHAYGYIHIKIYGKEYKAHRLAWLYTFGVVPEHEIDHINGERSDNRLCNLRLATRAENQQNRRKVKPGTSKHLGVFFHKREGKYRAQIQFQGKRLQLGSFVNEDDAASAYNAAKHRLHLFNPTILQGLLT